MITPSQNIANPIIHAASNYLSVLPKLDYLMLNGKAPEIQPILIKMLGTFQECLEGMGYDHEVSQLALYMLCALGDEQVLSRQFRQAASWPDACDWTHLSLVDHFFKNTLAGLKLYHMLDHHIHARQADADFVEFVLTVLNFGFKGQYQLRKDGEHQFAQLRQRLMALLYQEYQLQPPVKQPERGLYLETKRYLIKLNARIALLMLTLLFCALVGVMDITLAKQLDHLVSVTKDSMGLLFKGGA